MFSKKNIIISSIIFIISVIFLILSFNSLFAYNLFEKLLGLTLNSERWIPIFGKLLFIGFLFTLALALGILFLEQIITFYNKNTIIFFIICFGVIAFLCRLSCLSFTSVDYNSHLKPWFETFKADRLNAFRSDVGDYTVIYKYLILIISFLPISSLYSYKFISIIFDYLLAIYSYKFIFKITEDKNKSLFTFAAILFTPNIILNSSMWAQCDSIFTFFILLSCYYLFLKNEKKSIIFFTIAFCFKIQAIFFLPVYVVSIMKREIKPKSFLYFPIIYFLVIIPAIILGMNPFYAFVGAYLKQTTSYQSLYFNVPNLYQIFNPGFENSNMSNLTLFLTLAICSIIAFIYINSKINDPKKLILISYLFTFIVPFVLPHMHERYFYLSDIFAILFAFTYTKYFYISIISISCSIPFLVQFLFGVNPSLNFVLFGFIMFIDLILLFKVFVKEFYTHPLNNQEKQ